MSQNNFDLAGFIDHTLLKPEATVEQINLLCDEAIKFKFKGVCVNSQHIELVSLRLKDFNILPVSVIGFPLGACHKEAKAFEAALAEKLGAKEIDMVLSVGLLKSSLFNEVLSDIKSVTNAVSCPVKVILETGLLTESEIVNATKIAVEGGAKFIKTCTGFSVGSAKVEHIDLIKKNIPSGVLIKASGGIKSQEQAVALIQAGSSRLGTSSGVALVSGLPPGSGY